MEEITGKGYRVPEVRSIRRAATGLREPSAAISSASHSSADRSSGRNHLPGAPMRRLLPLAQFMAESFIETPGVHRPRNVDWKRAAALLYGDWGTSKAYVIGLAFVAAGFASFPLILAVCALTAVVGSTTSSSARISPTAAAFIPRRGNKAASSRRPGALLLGGEFPRHGSAERLGGGELLRRPACNMRASRPWGSCSWSA